MNPIESSITYVHLDIKKTGEDADTSKEPNIEVDDEVNKLTPHRIKEFKDTLASICDDFSRTIHKLQSASIKWTKNKENLVSKIFHQRGVVNLMLSKGIRLNPSSNILPKTIPLVKKKSWPSKQKNHTGALRRLQKLHKLSTSTRSSNSYNASLADVSEGSVNLLIQQIKANIFEIDILNAIKEEAQLGIGIQKLLTEINMQKIPYSMVQFL